MEDKIRGMQQKHTIIGSQITKLFEEQKEIMDEISKAQHLESMSNMYHNSSEYAYHNTLSELTTLLVSMTQNNELNDNQKKKIKPLIDLAVSVIIEDKDKLNLNRLTELREASKVE